MGITRFSRKLNTLLYWFRLVPFCFLGSSLNPFWSLQGFSFVSYWSIVSGMWSLKFSFSTRLVATSPALRLGMVLSPKQELFHFISWVTISVESLEHSGLEKLGRFPLTDRLETRNQSEFLTVHDPWIVWESGNGLHTVSQWIFL